MDTHYSEIGEIAGKIYKCLETTGEKKASALQKEIKITDTALFNQGLGWLAREAKIDFRQDGKRLTVSLNRANV